MGSKIFEPNLFLYKHPKILNPSHSSYLPACEDGTGGVFLSSQTFSGEIPQHSQPQSTPVTQVQKSLAQKFSSQIFSCINTPTFSTLVIPHIYPPVKTEQTVFLSSQTFFRRNTPTFSTRHSSYIKITHTYLPVKMEQTVFQNVGI
jgi:hypothetical protein